MVNTYKEIRDENGNLIKGRTHLFITSCNDEGGITGSQSGTIIVPEGSGALFVVDDWLIPQIDKLLFVGGELIVKDGVQIDEPVKTEKELMIEELQRQMAELQAMPDEVLEGNVEPDEEGEESTEGE